MIKTIDIDIRGQICPSCLLLTLQEINRNVTEIHTGSIELLVITDDRHATNTIPAMVDRMGFCTEILRLGDDYRIRIFCCNLGTP